MKFYVKILGKKPSQKKICRRWIGAVGRGNKSRPFRQELLVCCISQGKISGVFVCHERREKLVHAIISVDLENPAQGRRRQSRQFIGESWPSRLLKRTDVTSYTWSDSIHMT